MKTTVTKKLIALLGGVVMLFSSTSIKAQHSAGDTLEMRKSKLDNLIKQNPYVFVGKLISTKKFTGTDKVEYVSNLFEVNEVIKGDLKTGTVEIVEQYFDRQLSRDFQSIVINGTTFNFCLDAKEVTKNSGVSNTNSKTLSISDATAFSGDKITQRFNYSVFRLYKTMSEFYSDLSKNYGISVPKELLEKKSPISTQASLNSNIPYSEKLKNVENYNKYLQKKALQRKSTPNQVNNTLGCTELYISEYLDGQSSNNAVEIYNPTNAAISLSNYKLLLYHGASYTPTTIALTGTISAYSTHVVAQQGANSTILSHANQTTNNLNFNGAVTTVLSKGTLHIDKIGEIGVSSSGNWTLTPTGGTNNADIRRMYNISVGDTSWSTCKAEWNVFSEDSTHNLGQHYNICGVDPDLNINFANPYSVDSSNGKSYFEFDVTAASIGANTYLDNAPLHIYYNSSAFGTNIVANGKVTIVNGASFNSSTYRVLNSSDYDQSPDTLGIGFGTDFSASSWSRTLITSTPIKLMRVFIEVQNCNQNANLQFVNTDITGSPFLTYYVSGQHDDPNTATDNAYTNINYGSNLNYTIPSSACGSGITITDFPSPVLAGVGQTITIIGTGFGTSRGSGQVKFTNADDGGTTHLHGLNANDYISWTDTQIQLTLPSFADTINPVDSNLIGGMSFIVTNNAGQSAFSTLNSSGNSFAIYFSLFDLRNVSTHNKNRVNLRQQDTSGGYILRLNPIDFPVGSPQRIVFTKAVHDWVCITGANLEIGKDTTITGTPIANDGVSYIFFGSTPLLGGTQHWAEYCTTDITSLKEGDIEFSNAPSTFAYDTNTTHNIPAGLYDFYETATHELGHLLGLEHNVVLTDLMYYSETSGNSASVRKHLVVSTSPADGGIYNFNHSVTILSVPGNCWPAMTTGKCSSPQVGIEKYQVGNFQLFPNPTTASITIQGTNSLGVITVYNAIGQLIMEQTTKETNTEIDLSGQASGFYIVNIGNNHIKVVKQ